MNADTVAIIKIIDFSLNYKKPFLQFESNWIFLVSLVIIPFFIYLLHKYYISKHINIYDLEVELSNVPRAKFKVQRNDENLFIANRIYLELISRKAVLPFDENNDVIKEIYDSWYKLFYIIRDEIKNVPGHYLKSHNATDSLIGLSIRILNDGLRPHLTMYQAKYRRWYDAELLKPQNKRLTPQQIQRKYPDYNSLVKSMHDVNQLMLDFSIELKRFIKG